MITTEELQLLEKTEGDILFFISSSADYANSFFKTYKPIDPSIRKNIEFVVDPSCRSFNKIFDLSNQVKNNLKRPSTVVKNNFLSAVNNLSSKVYSFVYIDTEESAIEELLYKVDKYINLQGLIICKSVDTSSYSDYINEYSGVITKVHDNGHVSWYKKKVMRLHKPVKRQFSNNF